MALLPLNKNLCPGFGSGRKKPTVPYEIDWSHPLATKLKFAILAGPGDQGAEIVNCCPVNHISSTIDYSEDMSFDTSASLAAVEVVGTEDWNLQAGENLSIFFRGAMLSSDSSGTFIAKRNDSACNFQVYTGSGNLYFRVGSTASTVTNFITSGKTGGHGITYNDTANTVEAWIYYDDGTSGNNSVACTTTPQDVSDPISLGARWGTYPTPSFDGDYQLAVVYIWNDRLLTEKDYISLNENPYQLLKPQIETFYFVPAAGGDTNISCSVDALTLTEYPASIAYDVGISATTDSLTLTEYAATVDYGINISATTDALTLTEYQASVAYDVGISATTDALTLTEYPASIAYGTNIDCTVDALTLTEYAATITYDVNVSASVDGLTLTEYPASVAYDFNISASTDALNLTTYSATIDYSGGTAISCGVDNLTLTTYPATIEGTEAVTESYSGGWEYPEPPTEEEIRKQRIKLGIIEPETPVKTAIKVRARREKYPQITESDILREEIKRLEALQKDFEQRKYRKPATPDKDILIQIQLNLNLLAEQQQRMEEQDIVFIMTTLLAA